MLANLSRVAVASQRIAGRRMFTAFTGAEQSVFAAGKAVREGADGSKNTFDLAVAFNNKPSLNLIVASYYNGSAPTVVPDSINEVLLVNKDGSSGKVKTITVEDPVASSTVKYTGSGFKWTGAQASITFTDGSKRETSFNFSDKAVPLKISVTGKDGKVVSKDSADLKVVTEAEFNSAVAAINAQINKYEGDRVRASMAQSQTAEE